MQILLTLIYKLPERRSWGGHRWVCWIGSSICDETRSGPSIIDMHLSSTALSIAQDKERKTELGRKKGRRKKRSRNERVLMNHYNGTTETAGFQRMQGWSVVQLWLSAYSLCVICCVCVQHCENTLARPLKQASTARSVTVPRYSHILHIKPTLRAEEENTGDKLCVILQLLPRGSPRKGKAMNIQNSSQYLPDQNKTLAWTLCDTDVNGWRRWRHGLIFPTQQWHAFHSKK